MSEPRASFVESIPVGMEDLRCISGVQFTEDALARLTGTAQSTIDLTAMYWALLPDPKGDDEKGFDEEDFSGMRAGAGQKLYGALGDAAARGVTIRILQSPGFSKSEQKGQSERLRDEFPARVFIHIAYHNKAVIYGILFSASAETMLTIAADPRHLGARIGLSAVLQSWGSAMTQNPHS
jgi:hypothetical protein